jgi:hypothetical protein
VSPIERLAAAQRSCGGFESSVMLPRGGVPDVNAFTTACVLRALRDVRALAIDGMKARALDFLQSCARSSAGGGYGFWPEDARPAWAARVPADVDDTALALVELVRHGRISSGDALRTLCLVILPCRVVGYQARVLPPWVRPGCFETWIVPRSAGSGRQVVDACVNANVAALMAYLGAFHLPGYGEAVATIDAGLAWAASDRTRLASLTPFYPSLGGFAEALAHAVECGASALGPAARHVEGLALEQADQAAPCCSSAYGNVAWRCPALDEARALAAAARD